MSTTTSPYVRLYGAALVCLVLVLVTPTARNHQGEAIMVWKYYDRYDTPGDIFVVTAMFALLLGAALIHAVTRPRPSTARGVTVAVLAVCFGATRLVDLIRLGERGFNLTELGIGAVVVAAGTALLGVAHAISLRATKQPADAAPE